MAKRKKLSIKAISIVGIVAVLVGSSIYGLVRLLNNGSGTESVQITTADGQKLTVEPTTGDEKQETEAHKEELSRSDGQSVSSPASVVITEASANIVRAYVAGVFEDGGICTATAVQGSQTITRQSTGFKNVSYTQCPPLEWSLSAGSWTVTVNYKSPRAEVSKSTEVQI